MARRGRPPKSAPVADAQRARILKVAERLFARDGYAGVSMRNVARDAGCSPAALYTLFPNKRALLTNIWEDAFVALDRVLAREEKNTRDPLERLRRLGRAYVNFWLAHQDHFRALFLIEDRLSEPGERYFVDTSHSLARVTGRFLAAAEAVVAAKQPGPTALALVELIFCALHGVASGLIGMPEYAWQSPKTLADRMMDALLGGLQTDSHR
jgi:AcrR family transcriptional regulator